MTHVVKEANMSQVYGRLRPITVQRTGFLASSPIANQITTPQNVEWPERDYLHGVDNAEWGPP